MAQETGEQVYRENIHDHTCRDIYKDFPECKDCIRVETVVDLRGIGPNSYCPGEIIIGDLDELGWMIVRGVIIDEPPYKEINAIGKLGCSGWGATWYPV